MRILTLLIALVYILSSCSDSRSNFKVEVDIKGTDGSMIYLSKRTVSGTSVVDSAVPEKSGKYILKGFTEQPEFYVLYHNPGAYINLIIHPGDDFKVLTDAASFDRNYIIEGSADSRLIQKMVNMQVRTLARITQLSSQYEDSRNSPDFEVTKREIDSAYQQVFKEHRKFSIQLIEQNPGSLASLMTLYQQLGQNAPVFNHNKDFRYYAMVDSNLSKLYPNSEAVIDLNHKVTELREILKLQPGSPAPDIALPDSTGSLIKLSSLKGKYVVLYFWASWSSRSASDLTRLESLYGQIGKNIEYYQVSLDRTRQSWLNSITEYGIHVCDLKYWDSPVVQAYHIEKIPAIYLCDPAGKIVRKEFSVEEIPAILQTLQ